MAHHYPVENSSQGEDDNTSAARRGEGQQHVGLGSSMPLQPIHPFGATVRSSPIAIVRSGEDQKRHPDTSDEEDDDEDGTIDVEFEGLSLASTATSGRTSSRSLPSHLLRAPRLGSVPSRNENTLDQCPTMLPPAVQSSENPLGPTPAGSSSAVRFGDNNETSYGSLRDSHERGRFLDGPSSYRDKRTGDIIRQGGRQRVRFQDSAPASLPTSLSIGDRIRISQQKQAAKKRGSTSQQKSEPTSSLTALLEASPAQRPEPEPDTPLPYVHPGTTSSSNPRTPTFYDQDNENGLPHHMLSTSLTGLEVLHRLGSAAATQPLTRDAPTLFENMQELPRDATGTNALLSRSHSDPTPYLRPRVPMAATSSSPLLLGRRSNMSPSNNVPPPFNLDSSTTSATTAATTTTAYHQVHHDGRLEDPPSAELPSTSDHNPDTDCAFDLEME